MAWGNSSVFQLVIIGNAQGGITGLFIYSGNPAAGNPPLLAIVPPGETTDPFGNSLAGIDILMQGNVITEAGGIFRTAATAPLIQLDGPHDAFLAYDAAGVLRESIAPVTTSDGIGNTVQAGFTSYAATPTTWARLFQQAAFFHMPADTVDASVGENNDGSLSASSAARAGAAFTSALTLVPGATAAAALAELSSALDLFNQPAIPPQATGGLAGPVAWGNNGSLNVVDGGDGQNYDTESITLFLASNQILSSTSFAHIFSHAFGIGTYKIDGWLVVSNTTAADAGEFTFGYTGTTTVPSLLDFTCTSGTSPAAVTYTATATFTQVFDTQPVAGNQKFEVHATIGFSSAGTLNFSGRELVAGNTVTVFGGSRLTISPVKAT